MTRSSTSTLEPFDLEIERTFRRLRNLVEARVSPKRERSIMEETPVIEAANMEGAGNKAVVGATKVQNKRRTLMEYAQPSIDGTASCIRKPPVQANNFELKPSYVSMIQNSVQFHGLPNEDPNLYIAYFLDICDMFRVNGVPDDAIRLRLFLFLKKDRARKWLNSLPAWFISDWATLAQEFLTKYFSPAKTVKLRNDITNFMQYDQESMYEAWERYKDLLRKCPHHELPS